MDMYKQKRMANNYQELIQVLTSVGQINLCANPDMGESVRLQIQEVQGSMARCTPEQKQEVTERAERLLAVVDAVTTWQKAAQPPPTRQPQARQREQDDEKVHEVRCQDIYADGNQYNLRNAPNIWAGTCVAQSFTAIITLSEALQSPVPITSRMLTESIQQAFATFAKGYKGEQQNWNIEDAVNLGGFGARLQCSPHEAGCLLDENAECLITLLAAVSLATDNSVHHFAAAIVITHGESFAIMQKGVGQQARYYHFDSHGNVETNNRAYLKCCTDHGAFINHLMAKYKPVDMGPRASEGERMYNVVNYRIVRDLHDYAFYNL
jgi:hypothetical protein